MINKTETTQAPSSVGMVETQLFHAASPLALESGQTLAPITLAYETYGTLNADKSNAILVLHALSGDAHAAGYHAVKDMGPWWDMMIGPGKALDTTRYFIVCSNVIGGCMGSSGPQSTNPATGAPYAMDFPIITIGDMVNAQRLLMDYLTIPRWCAVAGGSMGGMQALQWAVAYPELVERCIPIATTHRLSAQSIAFNAVGRTAIMHDPHWQCGNYYGKKIPANGLSTARMIAHITYLSEQSMHEKFGRSLRNADAYTWNFDPEFSVETYLAYKGDSFVKRFDANSYLYITKAMDYFDLGARAGSLVHAMEGVTARFLVMSFSSDWLFPTTQSRELVRALRLSGGDVSFMEVESPHGHDAFLLEADEITKLIKGFMR
ncbi:MAG TPA: homoserine O-acetyltransferase [Armatimonadota bacterium]|jgi:homoserine O-acetyltransferase